jgi:hypothetical protein
MTKRTTNTVLPAQPGWDVVIARKSGLWFEPIVGWAVSHIEDIEDPEEIDHYIEPLTAEGTVRQGWPKAYWGIRRPSGVIEFYGQYYSRPLDLERALAEEKVA